MNGCKIMCVQGGGASIIAFFHSNQFIMDKLSANIFEYTDCVFEPKNPRALFEIFSANLSGMTFNHCRFTRMNMHDVMFNNTVFNDCVFNNCFFLDNCKYQGVLFNHCSINNSRVYLPDKDDVTNFNGCEINDSYIGVCGVFVPWRIAGNRTSPARAM